jgi:hypothetical protein
MAGTPHTRSFGYSETPGWSRLLAVVVALRLMMVAVLAQYNVGDLGSVVSGNWTTAATWRTWNGTAWALPAVVPTSTSNVHILAGTVVTVNGAGPYAVNNLSVEANGKLWSANNPVNVYLTIFGSTLRCDGQIGDGATFDGLSFNIDGANTTILGTGQFDTSRIRKNFGVNATTNLSIQMDITLRFSIASATQLYNNHDGTCVFNVTVEPGVTVTLTGAGNAAIDGIDGNSPWARGGTFRIRGTMIIPGTLYLWSNNPVGSPLCQWVIENGGQVRAGTITASASGVAGHVTTIEDGGTLEVTGSPTAWATYSTTNNTYSFLPGSTFIYSGAGAQVVRPVAGGYGNLVIRGTGTKTLGGATLVKGDLLLSNADGTAQLDVTASNFQITLRGNWNSYNETAFVERSGRVVLEQGALQTITTAGGERFFNLRLAKTVGTTAQLGSDVVVANGLELNNGILDLNARELELLNGAPTAISTTSTFNATRHIRSERTDNLSRVSWHIGTNNGPHAVPFGRADGYVPFVFNRTAGDAGVVTMATYGTGPNNLPWPIWPIFVLNLNGPLGLMPDNRDATVDRFWYVGTTGSPTATLTFTYRFEELPVAPWNDPFALHAQRYDNVDNAWELPIELQTRALYNVTVQNVTAFGAWTLTPIGSPLPIELLEFTATPKGPVVDLAWVTLTERDNDHFTVLRSANGKDFLPLFRIPGAGYSHVLRRYDAVDDAPLSGTSFYKLRQTDRDGTWSESAVVVVRRNDNGTITAYPNPATDVLHVAGLPERSERLVVFDATGRMVRVWSVEGDAVTVNLAVGDLARGRYTLLVESAAPIALPFHKD